MRNTPIRGAGMELLLLEIVSSLKALINQPDLDSKIKDAYALNDSEKAQLEKALETISTAKAISQEQERQAAVYADIENRIAEAKSVQKANKENLANINSATAANNNLSAQIDEKMKELKVESDLRDRHEEKLAARERELREFEQSLFNQKAEIRAAVDKSKSILGEIGG